MWYNLSTDVTYKYLFSDSIPKKGVSTIDVNLIQV